MIDMKIYIAEQKALIGPLTNKAGELLMYNRSNLECRAFEAER